MAVLKSVCSTQKTMIMDIPRTEFEERLLKEQREIQILFLKAAEVTSNLEKRQMHMAELSVNKSSCMMKVEFSCVGIVSLTMKR